MSPHLNRTLPARVRTVARRTIEIARVNRALPALESELPHNTKMSSDDDESSAPPVVTAEPVESVAAPDAPDLLVPVKTTPPSLIEPEALAKGLHYLQERIPEFTQLTVREKRSHARAANLDPEFIENGLHAARVWRETKTLVKRTGEELTEEQEEIRRWDEVIRDLRAFLDGIEAANVKRKHRLGTAILQIYRMLAVYLNRPQPEDLYMRPYYDNMKRAYMRTQQFRRRKKSDESEE
jgi:hypothetical protein